MCRLLACTITAALCGCSASLCEPPRQVVTPSSSTERGTLQYGQFQFEETSQSWVNQSLVARSDGSVVCVTCSGIFSIDGSFHQTASLEGASPSGVVVAPDDSIYTMVPGRDRGTTDIVALSRSGATHWRSTLGTRFERIGLAASNDSLYASAAPFDETSQLQTTTLFAFDAATGAQRTVATGVQLIGPAHRGVITIAPHELSAAPTVQQIDPAGNVAWSHTIHVSNGTLPAIGGSLGASDGGVIVFGTTIYNVDLGDLVIHIPAANINRDNGFVVAFDATGATRWGFAVDSGGVTHVAATAQGELLVASQRQVGGGLLSPQIDTYLAVATPAGVTRSLTIDGAGIQEILGLAAAPDGAAWIQVLNARSSDDDDELPPIAQIGDHGFPELGVYLFKIVP